jgi:heterodisulfide reductase subunit D
MPLKDSVIKSLRKMLGDSNVLTDPEDLYVYSFEQIFRQRQYPHIEAVAKASSDRQIKEILRLLKAGNVQAIVRSESENITLQTSSRAKVLIDDATAPKLESLLEQTEKKSSHPSLEHEIRKTGHGSFLNYALALKSFLADLPSQKCLSCQACSGYCTVGHAFSNVETWSSKGRTILTRALSNGDLQPTPKLAEILYSCSLCGFCFAECFENNTQVRKAIMDARHRIVQQGATPEIFLATAKTISETGDPSGTPLSKRTAWSRQISQKGIFSDKAPVLYWAGCVASTRTPNTPKALGNVLNRAQVDFTYLGEKEGCCGYVMLAAGLWSEARQNALQVAERLRQTKAETLITTCAGCYYTFTKMYPEILHIELPCKVMHATQFVERLIKQKSLVPHSLNLKVTYHDPCSLGRHSNVYDQPRNVLKAVPKLDFVEMPLSRSRSRCCGAGGGLWSFNNTLATSCATERLVNDVVPLGASALATACPTCHINLRNAAARKTSGIKVYDVVELVESATA